MTTHTLKIISLHDAQARCSCNGWFYSATGTRTPDHIREQWRMHAENPVKTKEEIDHIVKCHEGLVAALKATLPHLPHSIGDVLHPVLSQARAAIRKAESLP